MAFEEVVTVPGDPQKYRLNVAVKRYALLDLGFVRNNAGAYVMERSLQPMKGLAKAIKLKVVVNQDLTGIKIKTVNPVGTAKVNIFNLADNGALLELYHYYLDELVTREILQRVA